MLQKSILLVPQNIVIDLIDVMTFVSSLIPFYVVRIDTMHARILYYTEPEIIYIPFIEASIACEGGANG